MGSREIPSVAASRLPPATRQPRWSQQAAMDADPVEVSSPRARPRLRSGRKWGPTSSRGWIRPSLSSPRAPASSWCSPPAPPPLVLVGRRTTPSPPRGAPRGPPQAQLQRAQLRSRKAQLRLAPSLTAPAWLRPSGPCRPSLPAPEPACPGLHLHRPAC
ncbi:wiskott-Aldrich syndrome protein homolog 1-like [Triticum dicoccoides]|uniref:wiskott-Aldrich syndrome protein homolog 1-like n=1 Tax=Triticum dicoccoides TaxID=85692 RepID=UPI00188DFFDE|nr:wiskott-Aldrich syndrome protein homolog 1-like [Triticum dicoccoides]